MTHFSALELLVLHAVRLAGMADAPAAARRFRLDQTQVEEILLDDQAMGWVTWSQFAGTGGWSLTERGRAENERQLAAELSELGGAAVVGEVYQAFLPLNEQLQRACTNWQLRPTGDDALAANDHTDPVWDERVLDDLAALEGRLGPMVDRLTSVLARFGGYDARFGGALDLVRAGEWGWVDRTGADSCHTVWFELHEDLIATLGLRRGT